MPEIFTEKDVRDWLRREVDEAGGIAAWARPRDFSPQYVSGVIGGARPLSPRILGELGFVRVVHYIPKEPHHGQAPEERRRSAGRP